MTTKTVITCDRCKQPITNPHQRYTLTVRVESPLNADADNTFSDWVADLHKDCMMELREEIRAIITKVVLEDEWTSVAIARPRHNELRQWAQKHKRSIAQELDQILETAGVPELEAVE